MDTELHLYLVIVETYTCRRESKVILCIMCAFKVRRKQANRILFLMPFVLLIALKIVSRQLYKYEHRHGKPLELYYKTGLLVTDLEYKLPRPKPSGLSVHCDIVVQSGIDPRTLYLSMEQAEITEFMEDKEHELELGLTDCSNFIKDMGYVTDPLTNTEKEFPIAYSILVYKDFVQVEMLLRAIYRPQNVYCIHVDLKSDPTLRSKIEKLVSCFKNISIPKKIVNVTWGEFSVLEADLVCLEELWNKSVKWKYWINLTGQEFPLRTNYELVKILKVFNGANNVNAQRRSRTVVRRLRNSGPPPFPYEYMKGAVHVILSRDFVDFVLHNETARRLLDWSRKVNVPDEIFFNTLNYSPSVGAPGSYRGRHPETNLKNPFLARFKNWWREWDCRGKEVRDICIFDLGDIPLLATREELFANKFHFDYSPETLYCLEELLYNRTVNEYHRTLDFNVSYYKTRDFVWNRF